MAGDRGRSERIHVGTVMTPAEVLKREEALARREKLELTLLQQVRAERSLMQPVRQALFHHTRKWRFDLAWPGSMLAVEVDGLTHTGGRHQTVAGFSEDCVKLNEAALLGWRVLRVTAKHIRSGVALEWIRRALA